MSVAYESFLHGIVRYENKLGSQSEPAVSAGEPWTE